LREQFMNSKAATDAEVIAYAARRGLDPLQLATEWESPHGKIDVNVSEVLRRLECVTTQSGKSMLQLALGWFTARPAIPTVIAGATRPEQVRANVAATLVELNAPERNALSALLDGLR
jgi:aryl-alcohol dehydrogenase-like predicted oxidoreductase